MRKVSYGLGATTVVLLQYRTNCHVGGIGFNCERSVGTQVGQHENGMATQGGPEGLKRALLLGTPQPRSTLLQQLR